MSDEFNVNAYWLERGRQSEGEEARYAEYHRLQEQFLFETLRKGGLPMHHVIELGCGSGRITRLLAENYPNATVSALDLSPERLELAARHCAGVGNVSFAQYDFYSDAPLPGSGYDAAVAIETFLHHPRTLVRSLVEKLSNISRCIVTIDWSEAWPWRPPEHVWIHDYQAVYAEAGLHCATFILPQKIDGMQQKLFIASKKMTHEMVRFLEMAEKAAAAQDAAQKAMAFSSVAQWAERLQRATGEILDLVPIGEAFILVNDDQWGNEAEFTGRRVLPFLERDGSYWGPPDNDRTAIAELERLRQAGASHIVFAWPSFWWLDYYAGLRTHLQTNYPCLLANERLVAFSLKSPAPA
jgi:SAM-dependent methyltransferase